jgi:ATP-dependent Clp protease ATP-binding subunit ClpB
MQIEKYTDRLKTRVQSAQGLALRNRHQQSEKDAALAGRFQPALIDEPTVEKTISILRGLKEKYELRHGVRITDSAIVAAATLSHRYITDRQLPDKAIDLIDEGASRLRMEIDSKPEAIDEFDRRIMQLKIEREALKRESNPAPKERTEKCRERSCRAGATLCGADSAMAEEEGKAVRGKAGAGTA